jgi:hypothetical protein
VALAVGLQYVALRTSSPFETQATEADAATAVFPVQPAPAGEAKTPGSTPPMSGKTEAPGTAGQQPAPPPSTGKRAKVQLAAGLAAAVIVIVGTVVLTRNSHAPAPAAAAAEANAGGGNSAVSAGGNTGPAMKATTFRDFVDQAKINTVIVGPPARAVINGKVVRAGEMVDATLGIVFDRVVSEQRAIFFKDKTGAILTRKY